MIGVDIGDISGDEMRWGSLCEYEYEFEFECKQSVDMAGVNAIAIASMDDAGMHTTPTKAQTQNTTASRVLLLIIVSWLPLPFLYYMI